LKTVVTGGCGFIGSHLVERLLADGHQVTVVDNLATGHLDNLGQCRKHPGLHLMEADVADGEAIRSAFPGVDWVFHLAGLTAIVPSVECPTDYFHANVAGTLQVLEAARCAGVKRFVYAASSSCYGLAEQFPTPETAPARPEHPYGLTKHLGEQLALHWCQVYKLPVVSLRFFNVYGPRARSSGAYGAVFGVFLAQKLAGQPLTVVGDGTQTRDFTFVTDVVEACVRAAQSDLTGEVLNVGSGGNYSVNQLVELLGGQVVHLPERPGEPHCTFADISKIKALLGWQPRFSFEEGVQVMLDNIHLWRKAPVWTPDTIAAATREWFRYLDSSR
jgi:UDP-glucose 4-epimerase